jgi:hypothetical protein
MSAKISDGSFIDSSDLKTLLRIVSNRAKGKTIEKNPSAEEPQIKIERVLKIEKICSKDGVTIDVSNLEIRTDICIDSSKYIETKINNEHGSYIVRIWTYEKLSFGCKCIDSLENEIYAEFPRKDYPDENSVIKFMKNWLGEGRMRKYS